MKSMKKQIHNRNSLLSKHPDLVSEWAYDLNILKPEDFMEHSNKSVWWHCQKCDQYWNAKIRDRVRGRGCPYCAGKSPIPCKNALATLHPELIVEWAYNFNNIKPEDVTEYSTKSVWWHCTKCNQYWNAKIRNRANGLGCPYCAGIRPILCKNALTTLHPELIVEWAYNLNKIRPEHVKEHSKKSVWWHCPKCNKYWKAKVSSRVGGSGCPYCSEKKSILGIEDEI